MKEDARREAINAFIIHNRAQVLSLDYYVKTHNTLAREYPNLVETVRFNRAMPEWL